MIAITEPTTMREALAAIHQLRRDLESERDWRKSLQNFQTLSHQQAAQINALVEQTHACKRAGYKAGWLAAGGDPSHIGAIAAAANAAVMYGERIGGAGRLGS